MYECEKLQGGKPLVSDNKPEKEKFTFFNKGDY